MAIREGLWQSKNDHDFILRSLRNGQRVDGRQLADMRLLRMVLGRSEGQASAEIQLGRTRVLGVVTGEVGATKSQAQLNLCVRLRAWLALFAVGVTVVGAQAKNMDKLLCLLGRWWPCADCNTSSFGLLLSLLLLLLLLLCVRPRCNTT